MAPGDIIYIYREQQKFVAVGALGASGQTSGVTGQYAFEQERLSLNEAVAKAGGLLDSAPTRARSSSIAWSIARRSRHGREPLEVPADQKFIPTVYRANFRDPSSFFFAQSFPMRHKDVIYVSNADSVEVVKFLDYLRTITSTVSGVAQDVLVTRDPARAVGGN